MSQNKPTKICINHFSILVSLFLIVVGFSQANGQVVVNKPVLMHSKALFLVSNNNGNILQIKESEWQLSIEKVCTIEGDIASQLQLLGISANGDAKSLVLHYNQSNSILDIEKNPGCYWFPAIKENDINKVQLAKNYLLRVSAFFEEKQKLWDETNSLYGILGIDIKSIAILTNSSVTEPLLSVIKNHNAFMTAVESNNVILPLELINQAIGEVGLLQTVYSRQSEDDKTLVSLIPSSKVDNLAKSMSARATAYGELFGQHVKVINRTSIPVKINLLNSAGVEQDNYEVFIVPSALKGVKGFRSQLGLTSPATGFVTAGYHTVWAVQFIQSGERVVSNYRELRINDFSIPQKELNLLLTITN
jgi:hypothetical protein